MAEYYKTQIARIYGFDIRTFNLRAEKAGIIKLIPHFYTHKAVFDVDDLLIIKQKLGTPEKIPRYVFYHKKKKKKKLAK